MEELRQLLMMPVKLWQRLPPSARFPALLTLLVGGGAFVGILMWSTHVSYVPLLTNLTAEDAAQIVDRLRTERVPYELAGGGTTVMVPENQFYELARKEIGALILSDEHPNIVRCFAMEEDSEFVYLALERCKQSLADLVTGEGGSVFLVDEAKHPTPFCIQVRQLNPALCCA